MSDSFYKMPYAASGNAGRWNPRGLRMIYTGSAPSVSLLEYLCIRGPVVGSKPWHMITYEIENDSLVASLDARNLPDDWADLPHTKSTQNLGKQWLEEREEPFLKVPSSRISLDFYPLEFNLLINPDFVDLQNLLKVVDSKPFNYVLNPW